VHTKPTSDQLQALQEERIKGAAVAITALVIAGARGSQAQAAQGSWADVA
jgi:hypothetical protein